MDLKKLLFLLVVLAANVVQGITGFAGTVLAMPPAVQLVGMQTARPILNALGLVSVLCVTVTSYRKVNLKELIKAAAVMTAGLFAGVCFKDLVSSHDRIMHLLLGVIVSLVGAVELIRVFLPKKKEHRHNGIVSGAILVAAGMIHGLFVCGGPLLVIYLQERLKDKDEFRATISSVWVILNSILLFDDIRLGNWGTETLQLFTVAVFVLGAAMLVGGYLYKKMKKETFMKVTYELLIVSGALMFI
ncbi:MAG: sulfite exporter TauE/SafE family protein [Clostridia bacterium]|nr:sulfite exporter TauE/SafE family protein [Clostridia bacterium]